MAETTAKLRLKLGQNFMSEHFSPVKIRVIFGAIFTKINKKIKIWQQSNKGTLVEIKKY